MHRLIAVGLAASPLTLAACHDGRNGGDAVRARYDNSADAVERQAQAQPEPTARKIYQARADALREEGRDRETGLNGGSPSSGPGGTTSR